MVDIVVVLFFSDTGSLVMYVIPICSLSNLIQIEIDADVLLGPVSWSRDSVLSLSFNRDCTTLVSLSFVVWISAFSLMSG